jgi:hypothetical protein
VLEVVAMGVGDRVRGVSQVLRLRSAGGRAGTRQEETATLWTTPWAWRDEAGLYIGWNKEAWLYWQLPINPLLWEDPGARLDLGNPIQGLLSEIGETNVDNSMGLALLSNPRQVHLLSLVWDEPGTPSPDATEELAEFQAACLDFQIPAKALVVGVKLRSDSALAAIKYKGLKGMLEQAKDVGTKALGEDIPNRDQFENDRLKVERILRRHGATAPDERTMAHLESWYNLGRGPDVLLQVADDSIYVSDFDRLEFAAVMRFRQKVMEAPLSQWALDAATHPNGPQVISIRGELQAPTVARSRARTAQRRIRAQMEEEMATGDLERVEDSMAFQQAQETENFIAMGQDPLFAHCSIIMARRVGPEAEETYMDELRQLYGIDMKPLVMRQLEALDETLPCSSKRTNPFLQDVSLEMLAYCGLQGWSNIGDPNGVFLGLADPDYTPVWLDPFGAPARNEPPAMGIFGEPGSGKALPLTAAVLTPSGWTTMGSVALGDEVVGRDGQPHRVVGVYPQGVLPLFRVTFSDGSFTDCCGDHLWAVREAAGTEHSAVWRTLSTSELAATGLQQPSGQDRWSIPMVDPVEFAATGSPFEPYLFGALLADTGADLHAGFGAPDPGIVDQVRALVADGTVPDAYRFASVADRVALLQGLFDAGGEPVDGGVVYTASSAHLADQVVELVQLLGGTARVTSKAPAGPASHGGSFDLAVDLPPGMVPFRLEHKLTSWSPAANGAVPARTIVSIVPAGSAAAQCIEVDAADRLYVTGHGVVTHNTYLCQLIATQSTLAGHQVIFINPKGFSTLSPFAELVDGSVVKMSELEESRSGFFDPFRFADPEMAAEIATNFILQVLGNTGVAGMGFTAEQELRLGAGLKRGAREGARCVLDALGYVEDYDVQRLVAEQMQSSALFSIGIASTPAARYQGRRGLTLIEFDRKLDFPEKGKSASTYSRAERISLAAVRLVTRASMEILVGSGGGVMIVDEAWTFLSSSEGLAALQQIGREGRSLNLLPIFATQRVDDLLREGIDMEGYMSRVMVMKLTDEREAAAALKLCGLEPSQDRIRWLRHAGPKGGRPAMGLHRDLSKRHSALYVGPVPPAAHIAFTTNPQERKELGLDVQPSYDEVDPFDDPVGGI